MLQLSEQRSESLARVTGLAFGRGARFEAFAGEIEAAFSVLGEPWPVTDT